MDIHQLHLKTKKLLLQIVSWFETIISILLIVSIVGLIAHLVLSMTQAGGSNFSEDIAQKMLQYCFEIVIAIEFVRMLSKHSVSSIIEIILFSIARSMIAESQKPIETVLLIVALLLLMVIRKYLLIPGDSEE